MSFLNRLLKISMGVFLAAPLAQAQLNPKWQATTGQDFLDLYQQNKAEKVKPEIVTLFDFSTSMEKIMFHSKFVNNYTQEDAAVNYAVRVTRGGIVGARTATPSFVISYDPTGGGGNPLSAYTVTGIGLVRPDGSLVTHALVANTQSNTKLPGSANGAEDIRNWVRAASHARIRFQRAGLDRTIDIPLHWCVIDPEQTLSNTDPTLKSLKIEDPAKVDSFNLWYEIDSTYLDENGTGTVLRMNNSSTTVTISDGAGVWRYDYLDWFVRLAMDPDSPSDYLIRNADDPDWYVNGAYRPYGLKKTDPAGFDYYTGLPRQSRLQAMKEACLRVWFKYQGDVWWAFRGLDEDSWESMSTSTNADPPSSVTVPTNNSTTGNDKKWYSMVAKSSSGDVHMGAKRLAKLVTSWIGTPLNSSYAETLVQFQDTSPWSYLEVGDKVRDCTKHFVMVMTDGVPNSEGTVQEGKSNMPYWSGAKDGNTSVNNNKSYINMYNSNNSYFNMATLAGVAAHASDPGKLTKVSVTKQNGSGELSNYLPLAIEHRADGWNDVTQQKDPNLDPVHPIQTLTVGMSLGKDPANPSSTATPDFRLKAAACFGNPGRASYPDPTTTIEYNPNPTGGIHDDREAFYFDASSPEKMVASLDAAFQYMMSAPSSNVTSMPAIPYVGVGLGHQIYLGRFDPPDAGGPVWSGDLMMFPTREENSQTIILDQSGNQITTDLKTAEAGWLASKVLHTKGWSQRIIYTRLPATSTNWNPGIQRVSDSGTNWDAIKAYVPGLDDTQKLTNLRWMMGANVMSTASPLPTRDGQDDTIDIMGDVIDSSPAVIEYNLTPTLISALPSVLQTAANAHASDTSRRFRVIFVGTNQGYLHAFGEISWEVNLEPDPKKTAKLITKAVADELWAFIPTDILSYIHYFRDPNNLHRAAVNGVPVVYHLDIPATGALAGNGKVDATEWASVLFGLGRGGRSYYSIDIRDPLSPKLGESGSYTGWALVPDEANSYPSTRFEADSSEASVVGKMGYSTCVPAIGRVIVGTDPSSATMRDVVFLGGGYSHFGIEDKNGGTKLGRNLFALDVSTGKVLKVWDLSTIANMGSVAVGSVPFRFFANTGLVQRLYFTDHFGGLWAINGMQMGTGDYTKFRIDSSTLDDWSDTPRPVYKQAAANGFSSTLPAPFRVAAFYPRTTAPLVIPPAVGIAMVSGDRNNPLDLNYKTSNSDPYKSVPNQHRLTVVFDRQDSALENLDTNGIVESQLQNMSSQTDPNATVITPGHSDFYLTNGKYGYYINFPARSNYTPKGIVPPMVLNGVVFWSYLDPRSVDPCTGGTGWTYTNRMCDVMRPTFPGNGVDASTQTSYQGCSNGEVAEWWGVASNIAAKSLIAVIQAGSQQGGVDPITGLPISTLGTKTFTGKFSSRFAQPRTWRSVQ